MRVDMMFTGFFRVMGSMEVMAVCKVSVVCGCFRTARLMMSRGFAVMTCGMLVMLGSFSMMVYSCVCAHPRSSFLEAKIRWGLPDGDDIRMTSP